MSAWFKSGDLNQRTMINRNFTHPVVKEDTSYRKCFRIQAESLAVCINDKGAYVSFKQEQ